MFLKRGWLFLLGMNFDVCLCDIHRPEGMFERSNLIKICSIPVVEGSSYLALPRFRVAWVYVCKYTYNAFLTFGTRSRHLLMERVEWINLGPPIGYLHWSLWICNQIDYIFSPLWRNHISDCKFELVMYRARVYKYTSYSHSIGNRRLSIRIWYQIDYIISALWRNHISEVKFEYKCIEQEYRSTIF